MNQPYRLALLVPLLLLAACSGPIPQETHDLTIRVQGSGTVTTLNGGVCVSVCTRELPAGSRVVLIASAPAASSFLGWRGACGGTGRCELELTRDLEVVAEFSGGTGEGPGTDPEGDAMLAPTGSDCDGIAVGSTCTATVELLGYGAAFRGLELVVATDRFALEGVAPGDAVASDCLAAAGPAGVVLACATAVGPSGEVLELRLRRTAREPGRVEIQDAAVVAGGSRTPVAGGALELRGGS